MYPVKLINKQAREINCLKENPNKLASVTNVQERKAWQLFAIKLMMLRFIIFFLVSEYQLPLFNCCSFCFMVSEIGGEGTLGEACCTPKTLVYVENKDGGIRTLFLKYLINKE